MPEERKLYKSFYEWYDNLSENDRTDLDAALVSQEISARKLFRNLKENEGVKFGDNAFYYHRTSLLNKENEV